MKSSGKKNIMKIKHIYRKSCKIIVYTLERPYHNVVWNVSKFVNHYGAMMYMVDDDCDNKNFWSDVSL